MWFLFHDRYKHTYQQIYVGFIIFILVTYYLGRVILTTSIFFFQALKAISNSIFKFSKEIHHNYKDGKGFIQSIKIWIEKRKASKNVPPKVELTKEQMRQNSINLFKKGISQRSADILSGSSSQNGLFSGERENKSPDST